MAMQHIEMTGKTIDEATSKALAQLGLDRDDVSVEVLDYGKKGFLGFGAVLARVRVSYGLEDETPAPPPPAPPKAHEQPQAPERPKAPEAPKAPASAPKPERKKPERPRPERIPRPEPLPEELPEVQPEDLGEPCTDEKAQKITAFLTGLLQHMESDAQVKVYLPEEGRYKVILEGDKLGSLIGRRGETLDAIQQLTNYSVNRSGEKRVRIHVDAENYRLKREQSLPPQRHLGAHERLRAARYPYRASGCGKYYHVFHGNRPQPPGHRRLRPRRPQGRPLRPVIEAPRRVL